MNIDNNKKVIYNPLENIPVNQNKTMSCIDIYLIDYNLFCDFADGKFDIVLAPDVKRFFDKMGKPKTKRDFKTSHEKYRDKWESYNNSRKNRTIRELNKKLINEHIEQKLLNSTIEKQIQWIELLNVHSQTTVNRKYECEYYDLKWEFSVIGFRKNDEKWHAHFELKWENHYGDNSAFDGVGYSELYSAIQKNVVHIEKKQVNPYIKPRKEGEQKKEINIASGDFVVRTNLFRCYNKEHLVEEIIGIVKIVTP